MEGNLHNYQIETFFIIKINQNTSKIIFFDRSSFRYSEDFNFGSEIIIKDIEKICSISKGTIMNFLSRNSNFNKSYTEQDFLEEKYFIKENFRKIRKKFIQDIANARINEIANIILNININIKTFNKNKPVIYVTIKDKIISCNIALKFFSKLLKF